MQKRHRLKFFFLATCLFFAANANADIWDEVEHGYADSDGVRIHYATVGEGPLVVMIHGFRIFGIAGVTRCKA